jgi:hypothetical protein
MFKRVLLALAMVVGCLAVPATVAAAGGTITGVVTDYLGAPVPGVSIAIAPNPFTPALVTTTGPLGDYSFTGLAPGPYLASFTPPAGRQDLVVMYYPDGSYNQAPGLGITAIADTTTTANQVLPRAGSISGTVHTSAGAGIAGAQVVPYLELAAGSVPFAGTVTAANGTYTLTRLGGFPGTTSTAGPGRYTVRITPPGDNQVILGPFDIVPGAALVGVDLSVQAPANGTAQLYSGGLPVPGTPPFQAPGICIAPGVFGIGSSFCPVGNFAPVAAQPNGTFVVGPIAAGTYTARAATAFGSPNGPPTTFTVNPGDSFHCDLPYDAPATCTVTPAGPPPPTDADGVPDSVEQGAPNGGDGNGDGSPDAAQSNVASTPDPTGGYTTVAAPTGQILTAVTVIAPAALPTPPVGVNGESGIVGFSVAVPTGAATTVDVFIDDPAGSVNSFWKYQGGAWVNATALATFSPAGGGRTKATLTLTDGAFGDADGAANGTIVDPGLFAKYTPYNFQGFGPLLALPQPYANPLVRGMIVPITWRLRTATGAPVTSTASIVSLKLLPGTCPTSAVAAPVTLVGVGQGLQSLGSGFWLFTWQTNRAWRGCGVLELKLADGTRHLTNVYFV